MNHAELVERAVKWLKNGAVIPFGSDGTRRVRCSVACAEMVTASRETPDAIGWWCCGQFSILVECKVSRSDFKSDSKKPFRVRPQDGAGDFRYYLTPPGLVTLEELPERWGLIECGGRSVSVARAAVRMEKSHRSEAHMLWSAVRRLKASDPKRRKPVR